MNAPSIESTCLQRLQQSEHMCLSKCSVTVHVELSAVVQVSSTCAVQMLQHAVSPPEEVVGLT